ncbi:ubiquitin-like protein 3, partial [Lates japonicus]
SKGGDLVWINLIRLECLSLHSLLKVTSCLKRCTSALSWSVGKRKTSLSPPMTRPQTSPSMCLRTGPAGWEEERVSSPSILRLIFQGRFLHGNVTLGALKLPPGRTTVMHLVARETLPEPNSHGQRNREKTTESNCCLLL